MLLYALVGLAVWQLLDTGRGVVLGKREGQ
jgi:hypothetical protein